MSDVIIIGAGPAGLQAALTLGRMHRSALVVDSGEYRNGTVLHMHNVVTNDGTAPAEFRAKARAQLAEYETIAIRQGKVAAVSPVDDGFEVRFDDGTVERAPRVMLATGMRDDLPDVPGLGELWGVRAFNCPFCDGHEFAGRRVGVLGADRAEHVVRMLRPIGASVTVFDGGGLDDGQRTALEALGATMHHAPVESVSADGDDVRVVAEDAVRVDGLFVTNATARQRAPFAEQLGLRILPSGAVEIDEFGRTSLPGVWAAGDLAHRATLPGIMAAVTLAAAAGQLAAIGIVQELAME
ncbi:NAD(P)/FAD-dependent oxidoreductase [Microbacterium esteraromaticum]|uniref:NAD(P)/FAD-dependent oxidoreductase n=1 Tax=Microbacterium esteraromaticum TaxID=57043 RepID=A0A7D8A8W1_9MICO|nr:NAD(P)/FAD-dependent oxidoreductase [Microbacterium esteraromaticum]QMU97320.1 NAD(P)/FAD-dependent oxidoreductase [Microbacterium esteraromaticum]